MYVCFYYTSVKHHITLLKLQQPCLLKDFHSCPRPPAFQTLLTTVGCVDLKINWPTPHCSPNTLLVKWGKVVSPKFLPRHCGQHMYFTHRLWILNRVIFQDQMFRSCLPALVKVGCFGDQLKEDIHWQAARRQLLESGRWCGPAGCSTSHQIKWVKVLVSVVWGDRT